MHAPTPDKTPVMFSIVPGSAPNAVRQDIIIETITHWCGHMKIDMIDSIYFCEIKDKSHVIKITETVHSKTKEWFC